MDPELLATLFDRHAAALELYAAQWTNAPADVVQEAFFRLVRQHPLPERIVPWLFRTVRNGAISAVRSSNRRKKHESLFAQSARLWFEGNSESGIDAEAATRALQEIPIEQREVVVAKIWGGLSFEQIAELTETSSSTTHRRYEAGLQSLRESLGMSWPKENSSLQN